MPKKSYMEHQGGWTLLATTVAQNAESLPALRQDLEILNQAMEEANQAKQRQLALRAATQQATRDLEDAMAKANDAAVRLHHGILAVYGYKSEKLKEFGFQPRRALGSRKKAPAAAEEAVPPVLKPRRRRK